MTYSHVLHSVFASIVAIGMAGCGSSPTAAERWAQMSGRADVVAYTDLVSAAQCASNPLLPAANAAAVEVDDADPLLRIAGMETPVEGAFEHFIMTAEAGKAYEIQVVAEMASSLTGAGAVVDPMILAIDGSGAPLAVEPVRVEILKPTFTRNMSIGGKWRLSGTGEIHIFVVASVGRLGKAVAASDWGVAVAGRGKTTRVVRVPANVFLVFHPSGPLEISVTAI